MKLRNKNKSRGFTLIEMLVALAILSMLALLASNAFDGSRSKAQVMLGLAKQVGDANLQLKTDTGCYVNKPRALFDATFAKDPNNNYCGRPFKNMWARPYMGQYTVDGNGSLMADKIGAGVLVSLKKEPSTLGTRYFVQFENVPMDVVRQALIECNNDQDAVTKGDLDKNRCRAASVDGDLPTTFDMIYDVTR